MNLVEDITTHQKGKEIKMINKSMSQMNSEKKLKNKFYIQYYSKSDGRKIKRPYDPNSEKQHEFIAGSGNLCKRYWDESKEGLRTANAPWTIKVKK